MAAGRKPHPLNLSLIVAVEDVAVSLERDRRIEGVVHERVHERGIVEVIAAADHVLDKILGAVAGALIGRRGKRCNLLKSKECAARESNPEPTD